MFIIYYYPDCVLPHQHTERGGPWPLVLWGPVMQHVVRTDESPNVDVDVTFPLCPQMPNSVSLPSYKYSRSRAALCHKSKQPRSQMCHLAAPSSSAVFYLWSRWIILLRNSLRWLDSETQTTAQDEAGEELWNVLWQSFHRPIYWCDGFTPLLYHSSTFTLK